MVWFEKSGESRQCKGIEAHKCIQTSPQLPYLTEDQQQCVDIPFAHLKDLLNFHDHRARITTIVFHKRLSSKLCTDVSMIKKKEVSGHSTIMNINISKREA